MFYELFFFDMSQAVSVSARLWRKYDPQFSAHFAHSISYLLDNDYDPLTILSKDVLIYVDHQEFLSHYDHSHTIIRELQELQGPTPPSPQPAIYADYGRSILQKRQRRLKRLKKNQMQLQSSKSRSSSLSVKQHFSPPTIQILNQPVSQIAFSELMASDEPSAITVEQEYSLMAHNVYQQDPGYIPEESYVLNQEGQFEAKQLSDDPLQIQQDIPTLSLQATSEDDISHLVMNFSETTGSSHWAPSIRRSTFNPFHKAVEGWENQLLGAQVHTPLKKREYYDRDQMQTVVKKQLQKYGVDTSGILSCSSRKTLVRDKAQTMLRQMRMGTTILTP